MLDHLIYIHSPRISQCLTKAQSAESVGFQVDDLVRSLENDITGIDSCYLDKQVRARNERDKAAATADVIQDTKNVSTL